MKKKHLALILPSLLSGCTIIHGSSNIVGTDTPALVFIDGQIRESTAILAQTQQRLLTPPAIARTKTMALTDTTGIKPTISESRPLPSPTIRQNFSRLIITGKPGNVPVTLSPAARNRTVSQWIKTLLPDGWQFKQENASTPKLNTRLISWSANDQWTRSLNRLLEEQHLWGHLDWDNRTLTITTSATSSPGNTTDTPATTPVKPVPVTENPVIPVSQGKEWRAPAGTTLRENIIKWAEETRCESMASAHWMVIWPLSVTDYRLDAPLIFRGSFESAIGQVFELYRSAQKPLYAQGSRTQCVITVSDTRDGR